MYKDRSKKKILTAKWWQELREKLGKERTRNQNFFDNITNFNTMTIKNKEGEILNYILHWPDT